MPSSLAPAVVRRWPSTSLFPRECRRSPNQTTSFAHSNLSAWHWESVVRKVRVACIWKPIGWGLVCLLMERWEWLLMENTGQSEIGDRMSSVIFDDIFGHRKWPLEGVYTETKGEALKISSSESISDKSSEHGGVSRLFSFPQWKRSSTRIESCRLVFHIMFYALLVWSRGWESQVLGVIFLGKGLSIARKNPVVNELNKSLIGCKIL